MPASTTIADASTTGGQLTLPPATTTADSADSSGAPAASDAAPLTASEVTTEATTEVPPPATSDDGSSSGLSGGDALGIAVAALLIGLLVGWLLGRRRRAQTVAPPTRGSTPPPPEPPPGPSPRSELVSVEHRAALVEGLVDVRDRVGTGATSDRIGSTLAGVGVVTIDPTGQPFDPDQHVILDSALTTDPALDGRVAEVVRYGYVEAGQRRRLAEVIVWRLEPNAR